MDLKIKDKIAVVTGGGSGIIPSLHAEIHSPGLRYPPGTGYPFREAPRRWSVSCVEPGRGARGSGGEVMLHS